MASSVEDIYVTGLQNAHALEKQAVQLLERQVERLENYPEMEQRMRQHIQESQTQAQRLEQILERHGTSNSTLKDFATSVMGNLAAMAHAPMQDEVIKNTFANYAFEHFEIAAYRSLITMAAAAGDQQAVSLLQQSLNEEERMAEWLDKNIDATTQRYMQLETSGQKSGV
jgi:ferritin-like metal-binding protein YciE